MRTIPAQESLEIRFELDEGHYLTGRQITDEQMAAPALKRDAFHEEWNHSFSPREA